MQTHEKIIVILHRKLPAAALTNNKKRINCVLQQITVLQMLHSLHTAPLHGPHLQCSVQKNTRTSTFMIMKKCPI